MRESGYYPAGAEFDPNAPWYEPVVPERDFDVTCSQSLSKTTTVTTDNYIPGASGCDYEPDGEGGYCACGWHDPDDTSDTNWGKVYAEEHLTPLQLIQKFKEYLEGELKELKEVIEDQKFSVSSYLTQEERKLTHLIEECEGWTEDETEFIEE